MLEQVGRHLIEIHDTKVVMQALVSILERQQDGTIHQALVKSEPGAEPEVPGPQTLASGGGAAGLIIDWMANLQPELLGDDPKTQVNN